MADSQPPPTVHAAPGGLIERPLHRRVTIGLQAVLLLGVVLQLVQAQWLNALASTGVLLVTLLPLVLGRRFRVFIPSEFQLLAVIMVFASLFLGEVRGYFIRYWWWDVVLHAGSGFLLGILGFLLVFVLNEKEDLDVQLRPGFVALFAFTFSLGLGVLWEIFEFGMDQLFGLNMQKSGLRDTMWDLIVDTGAALAIALLGYYYLKQPGDDSFLERWIGRFVRANPRLFGR
jgi:uncharacterized membrane protein